MKTYLSPILLAALLLLPAWSPGQTSAVPSFISYQGEVLDGTGNFVGAGTPVNRTVTFRIWNHPSNTLQANLIYSEQQTVTIADGQFSVLIGQGVGTAGSQFGYSETNQGPQGSPMVDIAGAFATATCYLGVTVDDGTGAVDNEITPRQQIVSTAFAFRAKQAETVVDSAINTVSIADSSITQSKLAANSVVSGSILNSSVTLNKMANNSVDSGKIINGSIVAEDLANASVNSSKIQDGQVTNADLANGSVNSIKIQDGQVRNADLANGSVTAGKLGADVGYWNVSGTTRHYTTGYVGIGIGAPRSRLHVSSGPITVSEGGNTAGAGGSIQFGVTTFAGNKPMSMVKGTLENSASGEHQGGLAFHTRRVGAPSQSLGERMRILSDGRVGIGTTSPTQAKLVVAGVGGQDPVGNHASLLSDGRLLTEQGSYAFNDVSIKASNAVHAAYFRAVSDARIKLIEGRSDGSADLATLNSIEITDYTQKDHIQHGTRPQKKVIGQQVEQVFPQAVKLTTDVVPDIYKKARQKDGWVLLSTDLKTGDRVRLIAKNKEATHEVLEVRADAFRTAFQPGTDMVFVYGREVNDFHTVDYEAIAMLNVSATQELSRKLEQEKRENATLRERLAKLEAKDRARDAKLAAIEDALDGLDTARKKAIPVNSTAAR